MTYLAFRNLFQQKFRLAFSIGGVALALTLIVLLNGFLAGIYVQVTAYLDNIPADAAYDGQVFYFCAHGCRDEFLDAPEKFLVKQG